MTGTLRPAIESTQRGGSGRAGQSVVSAIAAPFEEKKLETEAAELAAEEERP